MQHVLSIIRRNISVWQYYQWRSTTWACVCAYIPLDGSAIWIIPYSQWWIEPLSTMPFSEKAAVSQYYALELAPPHGIYGHWCLGEKSKSEFLTLPIKYQKIQMYYLTILYVRSLSCNLSKIKGSIGLRYFLDSRGAFVSLPFPTCTDHPHPPAGNGGPSPQLASSAFP